MIERYAAGQGCDEARLLVQPQCALSPTQARFAFAVIAVPAALVALLSFMQGNSFAPVYSVAALVGLAWAFRVASRIAAQVEVINVSPRRLAVLRLPALEGVFDAPAGWVRLDTKHGHVTLASAGRRFEVGAGLGERERQDLARQIAVLLRWARQVNRIGR